MGWAIQERMCRAVFWCNFWQTEDVLYFFDLFAPHDSESPRDPFLQFVPPVAPSCKTEVTQGHVRQVQRAVDCAKGLLDNQDINLVFLNCRTNISGQEIASSEECDTAICRRFKKMDGINLYGRTSKWQPIPIVSDRLTVQAKP